MTYRLPAGGRIDRSRPLHFTFDGKSYQVDAINQKSGEILIQRIGQPGSIIVQIEGQRPLHSRQGQ